ncbi:MAG: dipeptide ABC transporter ATP-binding protein [Leptospiraceae bacterium]|nr:MAG: dipeptide ABC transporter ATP-binding protein [Leptospiraceae bacterium]
MIININKISTYYKIKKQLFTKPSWNYALRDISLSIQEGEVLAIVGESGCGKSTLGNTIAGLLSPYSGNIQFKNQTILTPEINHLKENKELRRKIQVIFQDPYSSLNPQHTIKRIIGSPMLIHKLANYKDYKEKVQYYLSLVKLDKNLIYRKPSELSGGQRQRVGIAKAIALEPEILICDEITSALDVSVQAFIIDLLFELKEKFKLTILFITHDLSLVRHISTKICVMYGGELMELGQTNEIFQNPKHPYTKALLSAVPTLNRNKKPYILKGEPPKTNEIYEYCIFYDRCPIRENQCKLEKPDLYNINNHFTKCFYYNKV